MFYTFLALVRHAVFLHQKMDCSISSPGNCNPDTLFRKKWVSPFHLVVFYTVHSCWHCPHCACAQKNGLSHFTTSCFAWTAFYSVRLGSLRLPICHAHTFSIEPSALSRGWFNRALYPLLFWQPTVGEELSHTGHFGFWIQWNLECDFRIRCVNLSAKKRDVWVPVEYGIELL